MRKVGILAGALMAGAMSVASALAQDDAVKIGVVAAHTGSFVSAGNTIGAGVKLAVKEINDAGGVKIGGKTYTLEPENRDDRTDVNVAIAAARELVEDVGVSGIWGTETHDFSISMTKITGPAKVLQFTGNSSLGAILTEEAVAPGGPTALHVPDRAAGVPAQRLDRPRRPQAARQGDRPTA